MAPVTPLTAMRVYILNWLSADPEDYDLDGKAEGVDFVVFEIPKEIHNALDAAGNVTLFWGGTGQVFKKDQVTEEVKVGGELQTRTQVKNIKLYHKAVSDSGTDYLVIKFTTNDYWPFVNAAGTAKEYAPGWLKTIPDISWTSDLSLINTIRTIFKVVWP